MQFFRLCFLHKCMACTCMHLVSIMKQFLLWYKQEIDEFLTIFCVRIKGRGLKRIYCGKFCVLVNASSNSR